MTKARSVLAATLLFVATLAVNPVLGATGGAADFIRQIGERAITHLTDKGISQQERQSRFRAILTDSFDLQAIAQFVLGRYWRTATPEQRDQFVSLFERFVVDAYAKRFSEYSGEQLKVDTVRDAPAGEAVVISHVTSPKGQLARVEWRIRQSDGSFRVVDVAIEGVSMSVTHRDEFSAVIQQNGGKVQALIDALRRKTSG